MLCGVMADSLLRLQQRRDRERSINSSNYTSCLQKGAERGDWQKHLKAKLWKWDLRFENAQEFMILS